jgi:hypothetical protein
MNSDLEHVILSPTSLPPFPKIQLLSPPHHHPHTYEPIYKNNITLKQHADTIRSFLARTRRIHISYYLGPKRQTGECRPNIKDSLLANNLNNHSPFFFLRKRGRINSKEILNSNNPPNSTQQKGPLSP